MDVHADIQTSHTVTLPCGCTVYVSCHPSTHVAHTRILERRGAGCRERFHHVGARLRLWELLPPSSPVRRTG